MSSSAAPSGTTAPKRGQGKKPSVSAGSRPIYRVKESTQGGKTPESRLNEGVDPPNTQARIVVPKVKGKTTGSIKSADGGPRAAVTTGPDSSSIKTPVGQQLLPPNNGGKRNEGGKKAANPKKGGKTYQPNVGGSSARFAGKPRVEVDGSKRPSGTPPESHGNRASNPLETTSDKTGPTQGLRTQFERPWVMNDKMLDILSGTFPMYQVSVKAKCALQLHDHPVSACERAMTEQLAIDSLRVAGCNVIVDAGGNPRRHQSAKRSGVHSCCPVLSPGDVIRNSRYDDTMDYCVNKVEDCDVIADGYLSVHSIYYLTPSLVLKLLHKSKRQIFVATAHKFLGGYGRLHFNGETYESNYAITGKGTVEMTVKGNDNGAYSHDPVFWLDTNYFVDGDKAMAWGYRKYGDTYVYTFRPAPLGLGCGITNRVLSLFESAHCDAHYGDVEVGLEPYRPTVNLLCIETQTVRSYGPLFWTNKQKQDIFVPKTLVNRLATFMVGKPRNKDTLQMCIREAKKMVGPKEMTISESLRVLLCIHVPALAFVIHLDDEIAAFNSLLEPKRVRAYKNLTSVLSFVPRPLRCFERVVACLAPTTYMVSGATQSTVGLAPSREGDLDDDHSVVAEAIMGTYAQDKTLLTTIRTKARGGFKFVATSACGTLKTIRSKAMIRIRGEGKEVPDDKIRLFQTAVVFADHIPVVARGDQQDELHALQNRVVMEVGTSDKAHWARLEQHVLQFKHVDTRDIRSSINFDEGSAFETWNALFPKGKRNNQLRAYTDLMSRPLEEKDFVRKSFCKLEKALKLHADDGELEEFIPRAIQGATDHANVALGPFISQVSKALAHQWNGKGKFYYTSGATGESIGKWFQTHYTPGDFIVDIDFSSYDGTQNRNTFNLTREFYAQCGAGEYGDALRVIDSHKNIHGFTRNDIEYRVDDGMCSGNPDTSCSNSLVTGLSSEFGYYNLFGTTDDIHLAIMGDDNTAIIPKRYMDTISSDELKDNLKDHFRSLGFVAKINVTDCVPKAEFCSGLFWPAVVDGEETYVLGAKPGKQLPKMGYSLKDHPPAVVAGMLEGLSVAYAHVPLLKEYVTICRGKIKDQAVAYVDPESRYKIRRDGKTVSRSVHLADFFEERYGLDLVMCTESLSELLKNSNLNEMVHWCYLDTIVHTDC